MRREIALQLLNETLSDSGLSEEQRNRIFLELETLAEYKYNSYEMYRPGRLFLENLYVWLSQFSGEQKKVALEFAANQIIFVSRKEMHQLAGVLYNDIVRTILRDNVAAKLNLPVYMTTRIFSSREFKDLHRSTLFLAMSDGARVDYFRRQNREIGNEQIVPYYLVSREKRQKMKDDLANDLLDASAKFRYVFLLDDFCGSGRTFLREQVVVSIDDSKAIPEIPRHIRAIVQFDKLQKKLILKSEGLPTQSEQSMIRQLSPAREFRVAFDELLRKKENHDIEFTGSFMKLMSKGDGLSDILEPSAKIYYSPLLSTEQAYGRLGRIVERQIGHSDIGRLNLTPVCKISDAMRINKGSHEISGLCEQYYKPSMADEHTGDVKYGYAECGLPLVMHHNTPNNSIFLLWCAREGFEPLFVRFERHGREMI